MALLSVKKLIIMALRQILAAVCLSPVYPGLIKVFLPITLLIWINVGE
jgi:hypothetical protein